MKIIAQGNPERAYYMRQEWVKFTCNICGCIWLAKRGEYEIINQYNELVYACSCPTCGERCHSNTFEPYNK